MKLGFDIDFTVVTQGTPELNYSDAKAIPEMVEYVNELYEAGHEIHFFTARHFKHFLTTKKMLDDAGFKYHSLILNKPCFDLFIDDRAFRMDNNLPELKELIKKLEADKCQ